MEHTNHPFRKENDLPNLHDYVPAVNLQGFPCATWGGHGFLRFSRGLTHLQNFMIVLLGSNPSKWPMKSIWVFPKIRVPQNGWFIMENPIKMDDLGESLFLETAISIGKCSSLSPPFVFESCSPNTNFWNSVQWTFFFELDGRFSMGFPSPPVCYDISN